MPLLLEIEDRASKQLIDLPARDGVRVRQRIVAYADDPGGQQHDCIPLVGQNDMFRLRSGDWRIIFKIERGVMRVVKILHRREAYR